MSGILHQIGMKHGTDKATFHGYLDFYQEHLPANPDRLLELGVMDGASLKMWRDYYPDAEIIGVDPFRPTKVNGCSVYPSDATDAEDMRPVIARGPFDVIIDDGSHMTADQQQSFELLWPAVAPGGVYVIEDLHTSFMSNYVNTPTTTVEWLMALDHLLPAFADPVAWFARGQGEPDQFLASHGFDPGKIEWTGTGPAESMTAVITKPC